MDRDQALRKRQGARLKAARLEAGYRSARAAAHENEWPESSYRAHEAGTRTMGLDDAERYARRYRAEGVRVSAKSILFDSETRTRPEPEAPAAVAPRLSWVAASKMTDVGEVPHPSDAPAVLIGDLPPGDWFALKVRGDSMDLIAPDGATILVNRADKRLVRNKFYVFSNGGEATFKRYVDRPMRRLEPCSSNRSHEPIYPGRDFVVVGRVHRVIVDL
jgi:phage repressor protein C with HTH and peptisase S24 domain